MVTSPLESLTSLEFIKSVCLFVCLSYLCCVEKWDVFVEYHLKLVKCFVAQTLKQRWYPWTNSTVGINCSVGSLLIILPSVQFTWEPRWVRLRMEVVPVRKQICLHKGIHLGNPRRNPSRPDKLIPLAWDQILPTRVFSYIDFSFEMSIHSDVWDREEIIPRQAQNTQNWFQSCYSIVKTVRKTDAR